MCSSCATGKDAVAGDGREFAVAGMSCQSCAIRIGSAVKAVPGVTDVRVDLASGRVMVVGPADDETIRAAVAGAGYSVTGP